MTGGSRLYSEMGASQRAKLEAEAEWLISAIREEAVLRNQDLEDIDLWILRNPVWEFDEELRQQVTKTHNTCVLLVRSYIIRRVNEGVPTLDIRPGLTVPKDFELKYEQLFVTEMPWFVSTVLQSAFLGNPMTGEQEAWTPAVSSDKKTQPNRGDLNVSPGVGTGINWLYGLAIALILFVLIAVVTNASRTAGTNSTNSTPNIGQTSSSTAQMPIPDGYSIYDSQFAVKWVPPSSQICKESGIKRCSEIEVFIRTKCAGSRVYGTGNVENSSGVVISQMRGNVASQSPGQKILLTLEDTSGVSYPNGSRVKLEKLTC